MQSWSFGLTKCQHSISSWRWNFPVDRMAAFRTLLALCLLAAAMPGDTSGYTGYCNPGIRICAHSWSNYETSVAIIISPASFVISVTSANNVYLSFMQQPLLPRRLHPWSSLTRFPWLTIWQFPPRMKPCHESWLLPLTTLPPVTLPLITLLPAILPLCITHPLNLRLLSFLLHPVPFLSSPARRMHLRSVPDLIHCGCSFWDARLCWRLAMPCSLNWNSENQLIVLCLTNIRSQQWVGRKSDKLWMRPPPVVRSEERYSLDCVPKSKTNASLRCPDTRSVRLLLCSTVISRCSIANSRFPISLSHNTKLTPS